MGDREFALVERNGPLSSERELYAAPSLEELEEFIEVKVGGES